MPGGFLNKQTHLDDVRQQLNIQNKPISNPFKPVHVVLGSWR